ncbi:unnamed protein product [Camellia sinensis]|uniref:agamous-like MADS-box protein AGL80 n=1 Tax=Camellia sinensis TaxID=4442 RepID=UPI0010360CE7|nr:agamous-like MADS-box protein AGL80 [Camellia sinensis]
MTRKKVSLAYIENESARKSTFKKRKKGIMKKVNELSTLCGVDACAIIFSPYDAEPEVWPSHLGAQRIISRFRRMPELEQSRRMENQESYTRQRLTKAEEQLRKQHKDNRHKEMTHLMFQCLIGEGLQYLNMVDLHDLGVLLNQTMRDVDGRLELLTEAVLPQEMAMLNAMARGENSFNAQMPSGMAMPTMQNQQPIRSLLRSNVHPGLDGNVAYTFPLQWSRG